MGRKPEIKKEAEELQGILNEALAKHKRMVPVYGTIDPNRDFIDEAIQELIDSINYAAYGIRKLRNVQRRLKNGRERIL